MTGPTPLTPRFRQIADHAVLVEFAETVTNPALAAVRALDRALADAPLPGLREAVPAQVSLLVEFDPLLTDHAAIVQGLRLRLKTATQVDRAPAEHVVEVCYDDDLAPDLDTVARRTGLSREAVIAAHLAGAYQVGMYGFAPGYAYLAGVPPALQLDRKPAARPGVAAGSVLIAGPQCLVSTLTMPTGWWIIGRSPTKILLDDPAHPFRLDVGDRVTFRRIGRGGLAAAGKAASHG
jgi:inhibitor of KinA